jgi:hypothetical protein
MEKPDPSAIPLRGFYYHYKHDPEGVPNNYTYEVIGLVRETETEDFAVLYRPLYQSEWMSPATYNTRPLSSFVGSLEKEGQMIHRFRRITDEELISKFEAIAREMYPHS